MSRLPFGLAGGLVAGGLILLFVLETNIRQEALGLLGQAGLAIAAPFEAIFALPQRLNDLAFSRVQWATDLTAAERAKHLTAENEALRAQLKLVTKRPLGLLMGRLVYRDRNFGAYNLLIELEKPAEIKAGWAVIAPGDIFVGKVDRGQDRFAWLKFVADPGLTLSVISQQNRARGIIKGDGESLWLRLTAGSAPPVLGEPVFTDNLDPDVPPALLVGTVDALPAEVIAAEQVIKIKPAFQEFTLPLVFIVNNW